MKPLDRYLFYYTLIFSLVVTITALLSGFALDNLIASLLFLPIVLSSLYTLIRRRYLKYLKAEYYRTHPQVENPSHSLPSSLSSFTFSLKAFLSQKTPSFLITLGLYSFSLAALICKLTLVHFSSPAAFISPLPSSQVVIFPPLVNH
jgi:hypothetical protein